MAPWCALQDHAALTYHVVRKEWRGLARAHWIYGLTVVLLAILGTAVLREMPSGAPSSSLVALYTQRVLSFQLVSLFFAALLALPFLAIHTVQQECRGGAGDLATITRLQPANFVLGKALAVFGLFALIGIATMPLAGLGFLLSGVDVRKLILLALHLGAFAWCCACTGIAVGVWAHKTVAAWFYSVTHTVLLCVYPIILGHLAVWAFGPTLLSDVCYSLAPFTITGAAIAGRTVATAPYPALGFLYLLACAGIALWIATRCWTNRSSSEGNTVQTASASAEPGRESAGTPMPDGANPVFMRERSLPGFGSDYNLPYVFFFGVLWGALALLTDALLPTPFVSTTLIDYTRMLAVLALAPPLATRSLMRENEQGTLEQLKMSALTPRQIITGKTRALFHGAAPFLAGLYLMSLVNSFLFGREPLLLVTVHCLVWLPVYSIFLSRCAMLGALLSPGSLNGLVAGYGFAMAGAAMHFLLDTTIMLQNASALFRRADAAGLTVFWCIDAVLLFVLSIPLLDVTCRLLGRGDGRWRACGADNDER